ncbi:MAG: pilus assembly protein PilP [Nitrospinota bacterium]|nr:pilus assembly protein PilP [Nitrospinota bacterium]
MANVKLSFEYLQKIGFSRIGIRRLGLQIADKSGYAWYKKLDKKKQAVVLAGIAGLVIIIAGALVAYINHLKTVEIEKARGSFQKFVASRAKGETNEIAKLISLGFKENGMVYRDAVKYFGKKTPGLGANISEIKLGKDGAEITYKRIEIIDNKSNIKTITGEVWKKENGTYKLYHLSALDKVLLKKEFDTKAEKSEKKPEKSKKTEETAQTQEIAPPVILKSKSGMIIPVYNAEGKRDPFQSLIAGTEDDGKDLQGGVSRQCDPGRPRDFLESIDLMSMDLVGIISGEQKAALIETPNGSGYTLTKGMHIGRDCGKIIKIEMDRIIIAEKFYDRRTGFEVKNKEIKLRQEEE